MTPLPAESLEKIATLYEHLAAVALTDASPYLDRGEAMVASAELTNLARQFRSRAHCQRADTNRRNT